jgi:solute carrier family 13 (sodium-dependent dicarboxylate transporter), member 2/3/5
MIPESVAALIGAILLFFLPVSETQRSTITWKEAAQIDWGTILLFGGGLALGDDGRPRAGWLRPWDAGSRV